MSEQSQPDPRRHRALAVLSLAAFLASLDVFVVNVGFVQLGEDLGGSTSSLSWVLNAYAIVFAALLVPLGRLADRAGRRRGFLAGLAVFTLASAGCAAAGSVEVLVGFRVLQAAGAAALVPASLGLVLSAFPMEERAKAVRIWAATGALAAALGPAAGGVLVEASWRWVFLINLPVGLAALALTPRLVRESRDPAVTRRPDLAGSALLAGAIATLALGLVRGGEAWGWGDGRTLAALAASAVLLTAFARRSARHPLPVVEPALLRVRTFAAANLTAIAFSASFAGTLLLATLWLQEAFGFSAIETGLGIAPGPMMVPIFAAVAQRLSARTGSGPVTALGCSLFALGGLLLAVGADEGGSYATTFLPAWLIGGAGVGFALPEILSSATADLPPARAATGSAVVTMSRQVGFVLGVSVVVAVLGTPVPGALEGPFRDAWLVVAGMSAVGALLAPRMSRRPAAVPVAVTT